jgi:uncharacterized membrane protein
MHALDLLARRPPRSLSLLVDNRCARGAVIARLHKRSPKPAMRSRLSTHTQSLTSTLWFVPTLLIVCAAILGIVLVEVSVQVDSVVVSRWPRLFGGGAESARGMLATIAGSMITVAGVTFSLTMLAVTQASSQFTPRIHRTFMRDRPSQLVLGGLAGVFTYCLVVLRTIRGGEVTIFVPAVAVMAGLLLAIVGIGLLIYFIHHIASALQAPSIIAHVAADTSLTIARLFPRMSADPLPEPPPELARLARHAVWHPVAAERTGYVQRVDLSALLTIAARGKMVVRMDRSVGDFVASGSPLLSVACTDGAWPSMSRLLNEAFVLGPHRTIEQDAAFGVGQLTEIALKALSPSTNDPITAVTCVDYLIAVFIDVASRREEPQWRISDGVLRVIVAGPTFTTLVDSAFDEIRRAAASQPLVLSRLLEACRIIGAAVDDDERRCCLRRHIDRIEAQSALETFVDADRAVLAHEVAVARDALGACAAPADVRIGP